MRCNVNEIRNLSRRFFCRIRLIHATISKISKSANQIDENDPVIHAPKKNML